MGHPHISKDIEERIRELHAKGLSQSDIARQLGISQASVSLRYSRLGLASHAQQKLATELQQQIINLAGEGKTIAAIEAIVGVSDATVRRYMGMSAPEKWITTIAEQRQQVIELQARGWSRPRIAQEVGLSLGYVCKLSGGGRDPNRVFKAKRETLTIPAVCRVCGSTIKVILPNKPCESDFSIGFRKSYVLCGQCDTWYAADVLVSRAELESAWWSQVADDDDSD